jgi:FAD/FMN-containing dehydrogenase
MTEHDAAADKLSDADKHLSRRQFIGGTAAAAGALMLHGLPAGAAGSTSTGNSKIAAISDKSFDALRSKIKGQVVTPSAADFAQVRSDMVWNQIKPNRSPDVIVKVKDTADVVEAVNFARENKLKVVVHGGGHTWCGLAIREGGMTIDLGALNDAQIDKANKKAVIQPVISNRDISHMLAEQDLAFPIGHCPTVKASGYLLNGGMSWNMGHWGPACQSVEAIEFVTADGKVVTASATEHTDLFWAARGIGPGMFAVATRYHLKCYDLPKAIRSSTYWYSLADLKDVATEVVELGRKMPDKVELSIFLIKAPDSIADKCKDFNGFCCMIASVAFGMTEEESKAALAPLANGKMPAKALMKNLNDTDTFATLAEKSGDAWPENHRNWVENQCSKANPVDYLMALRDKFVQAPSIQSVIVFCQSTGDRPLLVPDANVSLSMDATSYGGIWTIFKDAKDDQANHTWHKEMVALLAPYTNQHYIGETDIVEDHKRIKESYAKDKWERMEKVRAKYDPDGVFFGFGGLKKA